MAKKAPTTVKMSNGSNSKKTSIGNGTHSKLSTNKGATRKRYRGQGK